MDSLENLHYAIGLLAYTVAFSDGKVQQEERTKFHRIVEAELYCKDYDFSVSDIIFQMMDKDKTDTATSYNWAMKEIKNNSHYLSPDLKKTFINVLEKVANAFPPVTSEENRILEKFKKDIEPIKGDPVFYVQSK